MEIQLDRFIFSTNHTAAVGSTAPPPSLPPPHDHLTARRCGHLFACPPFGLAKTQFCLQRHLPKLVLVESCCWFRQSGSQDKMCCCISRSCKRYTHENFQQSTWHRVQHQHSTKIYFGDVTTRSRRKQTTWRSLAELRCTSSSSLWTLLHLFISQKRRVAPVQRSDSTR
jgi:hypothetical protein